MKLVRSRIPEIVAAKGETEPFRQVTGRGEHMRLLDAKLDEELAEYRVHCDPSKLADLLAVIRDCAEADGIGWRGLREMEQEKRDRCGDFLGGVVWLGGDS
jgi:predicted house-cleaning noncanonical NTP pyrophosphatase (MazG superfamily)